MAKYLYLECNTGISGDMAVSSLLDLGADRDSLKKTLDSIKELNLGDFETIITPVEKSGIKALDFDVKLTIENPDHDMEYLYGQENRGEEEKHEEDGHDMGAHHHHDHHHAHRSYLDIKGIIDQLDMTEGARKTALKTFEIIAKAEGAVHGKPMDEVKFHEVGALDSIVDIVSAAVCFDDLMTKNSLEGCIVTSVVDGTGTVRCQHGVIPVPVPAVVRICENEALPITVTSRKGEFVTPTGAGFAAAVKTESHLPERMTILKCGIGAGKREHEIPGMVRAMLIETL